MNISFPINQIHNLDECKLYTKMYAVYGVGGLACVVLADHLQAALDYAADEDLLRQFKIDDADLDFDAEDSSHTALGGRGDYFDLTYMTVMEYSDLQLTSKEKPRRA